MQYKQIHHYISVSSPQKKTRGALFESCQLHTTQWITALTLKRCAQFEFNMSRICVTTACQAICNAVNFRQIIFKSEHMSAKAVRLSWKAGAGNPDFSLRFYCRSSFLFWYEIRIYRYRYIYPRISTYAHLRVYICISIYACIHRAATRAYRFSSLYTYVAYVKATSQKLREGRTNPKKSSRGRNKSERMSA